MRAERSGGGRAGVWARAQGSISTQELAMSRCLLTFSNLGLHVLFDVLYAYPSIFIPSPPST